MKVPEERLQWKHDAAKLDLYVDAMVRVLRDEANALPVAYMAVDTVYRPYLQWVHSAQEQGIDAHTTRNAAIHLINVMIIEIASRMNPVETMASWVDEFVSILIDELEHDLAKIASVATPTVATPAAE